VVRGPPVGDRCTSISTWKPEGRGGGGPVPPDSKGYSLYVLTIVIPTDGQAGWKELKIFILKVKDHEGPEGE
jgi:hypothetical protein